MRRVLFETGLGFCLDIGYAICYAAWAGIGLEEVIKCFMKLNLKVFHLFDGDISSQIDSHLNFCKGDFNLSRIIQMIPANSYVSIETKKNSKLNLNDFERDVEYFHECVRCMKI